MSPADRERRASERTRLGLPCAYVMQDPAGLETWEFVQGRGRILNMAQGGMLLLLDHHPRARQIIHVHLSHSNTGQTVSLVQVAWTRREDSGDQQWAGCKLIFGPYSLSHERICAPAEFVS